MELLIKVESTMTAISETGNLRAFLSVTTALLRHALPLVSPCCLLLDTFFSFRCPEMSLKRPLIDGPLLPKASLYSLWFPGLHFWPLSKMGATLACPHSQETSTNPNSKGIFQRNINLSSPVISVPLLCLLYAVFNFSNLSYTFPCPDTMAISKVIFSDAHCLDKGHCNYSPIFSFSSSLFIQIPLTYLVAALSFRELKACLSFSSLIVSLANSFITFIFTFFYLPT